MVSNFPILNNSISVSDKFVLLKFESLSKNSKTISNNLALKNSTTQAAAISIFSIKTLCPQRPLSLVKITLQVHNVNNSLSDWFKLIATTKFAVSSNQNCSAQNNFAAVFKFGIDRDRCSGNFNQNLFETNQTWN